MEAAELDSAQLEPHTRSRGGERLDVLTDVVDAEDRGAALVGRDGGAERRRERPGPRLRVEQLAQRALAREPEEDGTAEREQHVEPPHQLEVLRRRLAEADARVEADMLFRDPGGDRDRQPLLEERSHLGGDVVVARVEPASSEALPACASGRDTRRASATTPASSGSPRSAVTSLTSSAPSSSARRATSLFAVSIDTGTPSSRSSTGTTRRSSSSSGTPSDPGRVDSPPMSTIAAPSAIIRRAAAAATSGSRWSPPSEKLSGVTLTIPITAGRCKRSSTAGRLTLRGG